MDVAWITKSELNKMVKRDMPGLKFDIETFRKYEVLKITGDIKDDAIKLKRLETSLSRLQTLTDTVDGVKIYFGNKSQYSELVNALDICYTHSNNMPFAIDPIDNKIGNYIL